jgi:hypothetical protein
MDALIQTGHSNRDFALPKQRLFHDIGSDDLSDVLVQIGARSDHTLRRSRVIQVREQPIDLDGAPDIAGIFHSPAVPGTRCPGSCKTPDRSRSLNSPLVLLHTYCICSWCLPVKQDDTSPVRYPYIVQLHFDEASNPPEKCSPCSPPLIYTLAII